MPRWTNSYRSNYDASHRGRGWRTHRYTPSSTPAPPYGPLLLEISKSDLVPDAEKYKDCATIKNCELVASYNWLDKSTPTILIPGKPPKWSPLSVPAALQEDRGTYFRDRNAARYPSHPLEPAILASLSADHSLPAKTDVVACASTLANLLRFVRGEDRPFRMLAQEVGSTLFLTRRENSPTETIPNVRGHGHTFPESYTTWEDEVRGSASHVRVLRYRFGELNILLRFDADGYLADDAPSPPPGFTPPPSPPRSKPAAAATTTLDDLVDIFASNNVSAAAPTATTKLAVRHGGAVVPQRQVFELKTRVQWKKDSVDTLAEQLPRLWVAQIPHFVLAFHSNGVFNDIQVRSVADEVEAWERKHASELACLAALVHQIVSRVAKQPDKKLEVAFRGVGALELRLQRADVKDALSEHTIGVWKGEVDWCGIEGVKEGVPLDDEVSKIWDSEKYAHGFDLGRDEDDGGMDFTGCSEDCAYCGKCPH